MSPGQDRFTDRSIGTVQETPASAGRAGPCWFEFVSLSYTD